MITQANVTHHQDDGVIAFTPANRASADQLDQAGETILQLLHRAAGVAENHSRQALETAEQIADQLRAAEARVAELEAEIEGCRDRVERAEHWLHRIYTEIEDRFLRQGDDRSAMSGAPPRPQKTWRHGG